MCVRPMLSILDNQLNGDVCGCGCVTALLLLLKEAKFAWMVARLDE